MPLDSRRPRTPNGRQQDIREDGRNGHSGAWLAGLSYWLTVSGERSFLKMYIILTWISGPKENPQ